MPKIVIKDMDGEIQVFKGPGMKFFENARGVEIFDMSRVNDGPGAGKVAHYKNYQWVKAEDDKDPQPPAPRREEIDRYTRDELDQRDPNDRPDFRMLRDTPLEHVTAPPKKLPDFTGPVKFPEGTTFDGMGSATIPGPEPLPGTVTADGKPEEPPLSLDDLKAQGLLKTGKDLPPAEVSEFSYATMDPAEAVKLRFETDKVDAMNADERAAWMDALPEAERAALEDTAKKEKKRQQDAARKRASRAKKKKDNAPEPKTGAYGTSPVAAVVDPLREANEKAAEMLEDVAPPQIEDEVEDPLAKLAEAEERHQRRQDCETCGGTGTVPDPESEDPLDTMICPDC